MAPTRVTRVEKVGTLGYIAHIIQDSGGLSQRDGTPLSTATTFGVQHAVAPPSELHPSTPMWVTTQQWTAQLAK